MRLLRLKLPIMCLAGVCLVSGGLSAQQPSEAAPAPASSPTPPSAPVVPVDKADKDGSVWGALVYANNTPSTATLEDPAEFPNLDRRLGKVFPYQYFHLIGQHTQVVFREYESWVVPSRDVFLKLDSKGVAENGGLNLHVQVWQGQQVLVKTDTMLMPGSPLIIGGPKWRDGQLIFLLDLKKADARAAVH